jgi:hypothetical protein
MTNLPIEPPFIGDEGDMPATNPLMQRVLRFVNHHSELYIRHRKNGEYDKAIDSLLTVERYVGLVDRAARKGKCQLSWNDWATVQLTRRHVAVMRQKPIDEEMPEYSCG